MRLTLTLTCAPIFKSFVRIVLHCALANSVEQSATRLNSLRVCRPQTKTIASVDSPASSLYLSGRQIDVIAAP